MTGPPIYTANETGQTREIESKKSRLEIHELASNGLPFVWEHARAGEGAGEAEPGIRDLRILRQV